MVCLGIAFHFAMLTLGMCKIALPNPWAFKMQYLYARITGAGGSFGFFSPSVPRELEVQFEIETTDHRIIKTTLRDWTIVEVRVRLGNMIRLLAKNFEKENILRSVAASLSAVIFRQYPDAKTVTLRAFIYNFPSMEEYQRGVRPELKEVYSATFGHS
jgi:hypothetical protein